MISFLMKFMAVFIMISEFILKVELGIWLNNPIASCLISLCRLNMYAASATCFEPCLDSFHCNLMVYEN